MAVLTLQPDAGAGIDTSLTSAGNNLNYGIATNAFSAGRTTAGLVIRSLIRFDISDLPLGVAISSAVLKLRCGGESEAADATVSAHRALTEWFEGIRDGAMPGGEDGSTWNHRNHNGSVAWVGGVGGASGSDWAASATDSVIITGTGSFFDWDVTTDVQAFYAGTQNNYGWWILGTEAGNSLKTFNPSDTATAGNRPILEITYELGGETSGSAAGVATATATAASQNMAGNAAGVAVGTGHMIADGFLRASSIDGAATVSGTMPLQQMSGLAAGLALVTGRGRAVTLPRVPIWTAIVGPTTYSLSGGNPFYRLQATGLGISNIRNIKQRGPFQDGATRRDFRLDERFLNLVFLLQGVTRAQADTYRDTLIEIFKPLTNTPCQIRVTRDDGVIKQIDTYAVGVLDLPETENERFAATQRVIVQLEAPNPIWYGPTLQNLGFTSVLGGSEGFQIPMMIPWVQQPGDYINATESFYYEGNWKEYPVIVITGPAIDAKITNLTTDEKIDFAGYTIAAGDTRTIDLRFGTKTVKDSNGVLKNNELTPDSNLGTFHLEPSPGATGGINDIKVEILSGSTTATQVSLRYYNRYTHL